MLEVAAYAGGAVWLMGIAAFAVLALLPSNRPETFWGWVGCFFMVILWPGTLLLAMIMGLLDRFRSGSLRDRAGS